MDATAWSRVDRLGAVEECEVDKIRFHACSCDPEVNDSGMVKAVVKVGHSDVSFSSTRLLGPKKI